MAIRINNNNIDIQKNNKIINAVKYNGKLIYLCKDISCHVKDVSFYSGDSPNQLYIQLNHNYENINPDNYVDISKFLFGNYDESELSIYYDSNFNSWYVSYIGEEMPINKKEYNIKISYPGLLLENTFNVTILTRN